MQQIDCRSATPPLSPWPCDSPEHNKEMHDNKPVSPSLIYSNGPCGISAVTSISGTILIFNTVVREVRTHTDAFQMIAHFHFLKNILLQLCRTPAEWHM